MIESISSNNILGIALLGGFGGIVSFFYALILGHYRNGLYVRKLVIEIVGAIILATIVTQFFPDRKSSFVLPIAFFVGVLWAQLIQAIRNRITNIIETALYKFDKENRDE